MKKFFKVIVAIIIIAVLSVLIKISAQTQKLLAENKIVKKEYVVDSVALFSFIEKKENEAKIEAYFQKYNMPLHSYSKKFVEVAEKYDLPPFLLPTISIKESSGGKKVFKPFNPFGYGKKSFKDYDEAIEYVAYQLAHGKYYKGKTLEKKLKTYNSVIPNYLSETFSFMKKMANQKIDSIDYMYYIDSFKIEIEKVVEIERENSL